MTNDPSRPVRDLIRSQDRAALACLLPGDTSPRPYVSLVLVAVDHDLSPVLLLSDLAEHSRAIAADPRISLLFDGTAGLDQPLTGSRLSLVGRVAPTEDPRLRRRYLARHPDAEMYAGFRDFRFYRMEVERAHLVAGFGKIRWLLPADYAAATPSSPGLVDSEAEIVRHMNEDHADAIDLYAHKLLGLTGEGWRMTGMDGEGLDLRRAGRVARLALPHPATDAGSARKALVALAAKARAA
jgi:heme iron utilization protein